MIEAEGSGMLPAISRVGIFRKIVSIKEKKCVMDKAVSSHSSAIDPTRHLCFNKDARHTYSSGSSAGGTVLQHAMQLL